MLEKTINRRKQLVEEYNKPFETSGASEFC